MPINELIIALNKSRLNFNPNIIPQLWQSNHRVPEQVMDSLLTALEQSHEEHPDILGILVAECGPNYTVDL
jgi:hypothetical protein